MNGLGITELDLRVVQRVLEMGAGYVLDFSDRTFSAFFQDFGVNIGDAKYCGEGQSKAKRLRGFLRTGAPPLTGRVLAKLCRHRMLNGQAAPTDSDRTAYAAIVGRLGGSVDAQPSQGTEDELLKLIFKPQAFTRLPVDASTGKLLVSRMEEAGRCVRTKPT